MPDAPGLLDRDTTLSALEGELQRSVDLAGRIPADQPIPTCPQWDAAALLEHLGGVHRWATALLEQRAREPISRKALGVVAPGDGSWGPWMSQGAEGLLEVLRATPGDQAVWSWGADHHARWWARRQLHETAVHNADLTLALGGNYVLDPLVAADGMCELLDNAPVRLTWPDAKPPQLDATVHIHCNDTRDDGRGSDHSLLGDRGELMVTMADSQLGYTHGHGKGDTAVRGPASQLMLVMNRRLAPSEAEVDVFGSTEALDALLEAVGH